MGLEYSAVVKHLPGMQETFHSILRTEKGIPSPPQTEGVHHAHLHPETRSLNLSKLVQTNLNKFKFLLTGEDGKINKRMSLMSSRGLGQGTDSLGPEQ